MVQILPEWTDKSKIRIVLQHPDGEKKNHEFITSNRLNRELFIKPASNFKMPSIKKCDFVYKFIDSENKIVLLRIDNMGTYREAFEDWNSSGFMGNNRRAKSVYRRFHGISAPSDIQEVIAGVPSATEMFRNLFVKMKEAGTKQLLIDLRENDGGNSLMVQILMYFLYGKEKPDSAQKKNLNFLKSESILIYIFNDIKTETLTKSIRKERFL